MFAFHLPVQFRVVFQYRSRSTLYCTDPALDPEIGPVRSGAQLLCRTHLKFHYTRKPLSISAQECKPLTVLHPYGTGRSKMCVVSSSSVSVVLNETSESGRQLPQQPAEPFASKPKATSHNCHSSVKLAMFLVQNYFKLLSFHFFCSRITNVTHSYTLVTVATSMGASSSLCSTDEGLPSLMEPPDGPTPQPGTERYRRKMRFYGYLV